MCVYSQYLTQETDVLFSVTIYTRLSGFPPFFYVTVRFVLTVKQTVLSRELVVSAVVYSYDSPAGHVRLAEVSRRLVTLHKQPTRILPEHKMAVCVRWNFLGTCTKSFIAPGSHLPL